MAIVKVDSLKKVYGNFTSVDGISFSIEEGEVFGFLGPNGAGKTSTINMLIGLLKITSGTASVGGFDCAKEIKKAQSIMGIVPDESNLYDEMTGFDNLCFCGSLYGMKKEARMARARELLALFKLDGAQGKPFKSYSKGMRRKLCIAAGIIHSPKVLFLDEPTTGIDVESARMIRELILELKRQGTTIFITTHYIEDAQRICDRIAFIVGGKIVKIGTVAELMASDLDEFIMKMRHSGRVDKLSDEFIKRFPFGHIKEACAGECILSFKNRIPLKELVAFFDERGIEVYEAKEVERSLEDVFVKVTGIEAAKLQKEKEGRK